MKLSPQACSNGIAASRPAVWRPGVRLASEPVDNSLWQRIIIQAVAVVGRQRPDSYGPIGTAETVRKVGPNRASCEATIHAAITSSAAMNRVE